MINEWTIYGQGGSTDVRAVVRELEYHGGWMEDEFVTVTIKSPVPIKFKHGDYLIYRDSNERFSIDYDPSTIQKARKESNGEAFVYENVKLYSDWHAFKDVLFKDYVLNDNGLAYSQQAKFSFFAGSVEDLADRLQANLNRAFGTNVWKVYTPYAGRSSSRHNGNEWDTYYQSSGLEYGNIDINVSCDSISCKEALKQSYDLFGLSYIVIGKNVIIGGNKGIDIGENLEYGKGKGLFEVEKTIDEDQQVITKMYAYGSSDNLPLNYYANLHKQYRATILSVDKISSSELTPYVELTLVMDYKQSLFTQVDRWTDSQGNTYNNFGYVVRFKFNDTEITARVNNPKDSDDGRVHIYAEYSGGEDPADEPSLSKMQAFRNFVEGGRILVFTAGFDKNRWPSEGIDYGDSIYYPALLSISNLMLPGFPDMSLYQWALANGGTAIDPNTGLVGWRSYTAYFSKDAQRPWIKSLKSDNIGEREGAVYFDGSDNNVEKIYPTIGSGNNTVVQRSSVSDNGYLAEGTDLSFKLSVINGTFDWNEAWNDKQEDMYVNMTSGFCSGRAFKVLSRPEKKNGYWELKLERAYDSSLGRYFPYQDKATNDMSNYAQVMEYDTFVVTGIQLPKSFVDDAAVRLLIAALERLTKTDHPKVNYIPKIDEIFAAKDRDENGANSLYRKIRAGMMLTFKDTTTEKNNPQTGGIVYETITQRIDTITIKENGNNGIPTFDVVLKNEKEEDFQQRLKNQLSSIGGESKGSSSNPGVNESDIEELTDGMMSAKLFTQLFEVYGRVIDNELSDSEDAEETLISPKDWEKVFKEDDERWENWQYTHPDEPYRSLLNIKAKRGLWTEFYLSAFGNGESDDGAMELLWPLNDINASQMSTMPNIGDTIVYKGGHTFEWGKSGGLDGLELMDGEDEISYQSYNDIRTYDLSNNFLSLKNGGEIKGTVTLNRTLPNDWLNPDPTNKYDKYLLTRKDTEDLFEGKYVTVEFFNQLFRAQDANGDVVTNTKNATIRSIKAMFGFWTDEYISAYGNGQSSGGDTLELGGLLSELNKIESKHGADGTALVYKNGSWGFHAASGIDSTTLDSLLSTNYRWWGRSLVNGAVSGDIENADNIYINKNKFVNIQFNANTRYSVFGMNSNNDLLIGYGLKDTSYKTTITGGDIVSIGAGSNNNDTYGKYWTVFRNNGHVTINVNDDTDATRNIFLNVGGNIKANKFYFTNDVYLEYISSGSDKGLRLVGAGFWTDGFISAYGNGTSTDGIQLNTLLNELNSKAVGYGVLVRSASGWEWKSYGGGGSSIFNIADAGDFSTYFNAGTTTAKQAAKWATARNITIASSDGTGIGAAVSVDGSEAKTLLLPETIKATLSGDIINCSSIDSIAYFKNNRIGVMQNNPQYTLDVTGNIRATEVSWFPSIELIASTPYIDFHYGNSDADYTSRIISNSNGGLTIRSGSGATSLVVGTATNNDSIKIGGATLTWVAGQGLKIDTGFWSESFISAYGNGTSSEGGVDIVINKFQLSGTNLDLNINGVAKRADLSGLIPSASTLTIIENGTTKTWNPLIDGDETITIGGASGDFIPMKDLGTGNVNNLSGSFFFSGRNFIQSNSDYVGIQVGSSIDKWQITAIDSLKWRQNDNGGTNTNWGGWATILDSNNYSTYIEDTKNTAGSTNLASTKLYLVGAKSQADNPQTYSNSNVYIDKNNKVNAAGFIVSGGTSAQFMKADGSYDSNTYATQTWVTGKNYLTGITSSMVTNALGFAPAANSNLNNYLPLNGGKMTGTLEMTEDKVQINFRTGNSSYNSKIEYKTAGNEALVWANQNEVTSFIFKCGLNLTDSSQWSSITPSLQIKKQSVYINSLIENGVTPSYNFYVNGTSGFSDNVYVADGKYLYLKNSTVYMFGNGRNQLSVYANSILFNGTSIHSSDERLKDIHENLSVGIEDIARAPIFNFSWKRNPEYGWHLGSSANYWLNVFKFAVDESDEGYLGMDYGATALAAAVMTARKVLTHEEEIAALKQRIVELENEVELLRAA